VIMSYDDLLEALDAVLDRCDEWSGDSEPHGALIVAWLIEELEQRR